MQFRFPYVTCSIDSSRCDWNENKKEGGKSRREKNCFTNIFFFAHHDNYFVTLSDTDEIDTVALMDHHHYYSVAVVCDATP